MSWICSKCGGGQVTVRADRPSLDPRYAVGNCERCSRTLGEPDSAKVVPLIQSTRADIVEDRRRRERERRIIRNPRPDQQEEAAEIRRRWAREAEERRQAS